MSRSKKTKIRQLPGRGALNDLSKSQRTIADYAKSTPSTERQPNPAVILNLAKSKP
ncbi:MAG: hypothetical protein ABWY64_09150 [Tardiphaga sp.]